MRKGAGNPTPARLASAIVHGSASGKPDGGMNPTGQAFAADSFTPFYLKRATGMGIWKEITDPEGQI
jgi:hypothetical protein